MLFGGNKRAFEIAKELVRRGHSACVYHPETSAPSWVQTQGVDTKNLRSLSCDHNDLEIYFNPLFTDRALIENSNAKFRLLYVVNNGGNYQPAYQQWISDFRHEPWFLAAGNSGAWRNSYDLDGVRCFDLVGGIDLKTFYPATAQTNHDPIVTFQARPSRAWKGTGEIFEALELVETTLELRVFSSEPLQQPTKHRLDLRVNVPPEEMPNIYLGSTLFVHFEDATSGWANTAAETPFDVPISRTRLGLEYLKKSLTTCSCEIILSLRIASP